MREWQVVGQSVRGATHERNGMPNQDAIFWLPQSGRASSFVLTVADGHGSPRYHRSHIGAAFAVECAATLLFDFVHTQSNQGNLSLIKDATESWLPQKLVRKWSDAVMEHAKANPFATEGEPAIAYGATLLAAVVSDSFLLYLQLGDGEILTVNDAGEVSRPLAKDERLFGNETTSLCAPEAWRDFRFKLQPISHSHPALILLSTDGYPNSFRDDSGFLKVGSDILNLIKSKGLSSVEENLEQWLSDSTRAGSGDDVTLGLLYSAAS